MGDPLAIPSHRGGDGVQVWVIGQWLIDECLPPSEPHESVSAKRHVTLEEVGEWAIANKLAGDGGMHRVDRFHCGAELAKEHCAVQLEMVIVGAIHRVEIHRAVVLPIQQVGVDASVVTSNHILVVAAQDIDMGRHVL